MTDAPDLGRTLSTFALAVQQTLLDLLETPETAAAMAQALGWDITDADGLPLADLVAAAAEGRAAAEDVARLLQDHAGPLPLDQLASLLARLAAAGAAVQRFADKTAHADGLPPDLPLRLLEDILGFLAAIVLGAMGSAARPLAEIIGLLDFPQHDAITRPGGGEVRKAQQRPRLDPGALGRFVSDPPGALADRFGLRRPTPASASEVADAVFPALADLFRAIGLPAWYGQPGPAGTLTPAQREQISRVLWIAWEAGLASSVGSDEVADLDVAITLRDAADGRELVVAPTGGLAWDWLAGAWQARAALTGAVSPLAIRSDGVRFLRGGDALRLDVGLARAASDVPAVRFGAPDGPHLDIAAVGLGFHAGFATAPGGGALPPDIGAAVTLTGISLVAGASDGFLSAVLPKGARAQFDLALGWDHAKGLSLGGTAGLETGAVVNIDIGPLKVAGWHAALRGNNHGVEAELSLDAIVSLGPIVATVLRLGMFAELKTPGSGAAGGAHVTVGLKPPDGVALSVQSPAVSGGGSLVFDTGRQQYSGIVQLRVQNTIDLKAIGILNAKLPDGSSGFSLLLIITGEFPPLPLGLGFTLNGVGGLVGINRIVKTDVIRAGLRSGVIDSILFPPDPLAHVPALLQTLGAVFPVTPGRHVFGPMARIGWGSPTILTLDLALILEVPDPVRLLILGRLKVVLPDEPHAVIRIRMDALGVLDFARCEFSLDATLYDSRILALTLTGDMALRLSWGANPNFLLSVGGVHPHFAAPPGLPKLARLAIVLVDFDRDGVVARVRLECYLALTSNTAQFGARIDLYFKALGVEIYAMLGFDALLHWPPLTLEAELAAVVAISFNGVMLLGADLELTVTGPAPWHLSGQARFAFLGIQVRVPIEWHSDDNATPPPLPPPVDVRALLVAAVQDARNWQAIVGDAAAGVVSLRPAGSDATSATILLHPLGTLAVRQRVVPLATQLDRFGTAPLGDDRWFDLQPPPGVQAADAAEQFALAQFRTMADGDKLAAPSFEPRKAGLSFGSDALVASPALKITPVTQFSTATVLAGTPAAPAASAATESLRAEALVVLAAAPPGEPDPRLLNGLIAIGAAARAPVRAAGKARYRPRQAA